MTFDLQNPNPLEGDALRDHAANLLASKYGDVRIEYRSDGKKTDIYFSEKNFNKELKIYVEAKDYADRLSRSQVKSIWADYSGILEKNKPSLLLIITRNGLSADAQKYVDDERPDVAHNTIWQLEDDLLGITEYIRALTEVSNEDKLSQYYVPTRVYPVEYDSACSRSIERSSIELFGAIRSWLHAEESSPIAVLGGYGAGKTSFAKMLASSQAKIALEDPTARRPILIKLGAFSRYSNIEGILGAMFTHEYPVRSFSTRRFMHMNGEGRLLIILDGFDEMKHAMSWSDFRVQVSELRKLMGGKSRVLLLGRPSAFLSQEEHLQVLRGRRRNGDDWVKIPDWPEFTEYEVSSFNNEEMRDFIRRYLLSREDAPERREWVERRAEEVAALAGVDEEIFSKPVHSKILTELALDESVDLGKFQGGVSRWQLYELFFSMLAEREAGKDARRAISDKARLDFLREVAFWLWTENQRSTSFESMELPDRILANLPFLDGAERDIKRREYLTGSFLEKKDGDIFYFGHRSFAEFLVAQRMVLAPPSGEAHAVYGLLIDDGVGSFLEEDPAAKFVEGWADTLTSARGRIPVEYLAFLARTCGGGPALAAKFDVGSPWRTALDVIGSSGTIDEEIIGRAITAMRSPDNEVIALLYSLISLAWQSGDPQIGRVRRYGPRIVAALLDRLFEEASVVPNSNDNYRIKKSKIETKTLAVACINQTEMRKERYIIFNWRVFADEMKKHIEILGYSISSKDDDFAEMVWAGAAEFPIEEVSKHMKPANRQKVTAYYSHHKTLNAIDVPGAKH